MHPCHGLCQCVKLKIEQTWVVTSMHLLLEIGNFVFCDIPTVNINGQLLPYSVFYGNLEFKCNFEAVSTTRKL